MADDNDNSRHRKKIRKPQSNSFQMIDTTETKKTKKKKAVLQEGDDSTAYDLKASTNPRRKKNVVGKRAKTLERETAFTGDYDDQERPDSKSTKRKKRSNIKQMTDSQDLDIESSSRPHDKIKDKAKEDNLIKDDSVHYPDVVDEGTAENEEKTKKRKGKKRKEYHLTSTAAVSHYSEADFDYDLNLSPEDVVTSKDHNLEITEPPNLVPSLPSQPLNVVYVERTDGGGFRKVNKSNLEDMNTEKDINELKQKMNNITNSAQLGSSVFNIFMKIALFGEGLLAGFALWQIISISTIENQTNGTLAVLAYYSRLSQAAQSIYYFLLAIAAVSVMDRFDLESHEYISVITRFIRNPILALCIVIHILSLILSTSIAEIDDRIGLYNVNQSYWPTVTEQNVRKLTTQSQALFSSWKIVNLLRGILAIAGWMLVSFSPITVIPEKYLYGRKNDILGEDVGA